MVSVIVPAVLKLFLYSATDLDMHRRRNGNIALIEQGMQIAAEKYSIAYQMKSVLGIWLDVCRVKCRKCTLAC